MRLLDLYRHTDAALARALEERIGLAAIAVPAEWTRERRRPASRGRRPARARKPTRCAPISRSRPAAPPSSWRGPTVRGSGRSPSTAGIPMPTREPSTGRLAALLGALDGAIAAIETGMGPAWRDTVVAVVTEFGRTARINGTEGTDHGTATIALLAGGAVKGGRVIADWPGLKTAQSARPARPQADHRPAGRDQGRAAGSPAACPTGAGGQSVPGQRGAKPLPGSSPGYERSHRRRRIFSKPLAFAHCTALSARSGGGGYDVMKK